MIPNIGPLEIAIVLIIALIVFGPKRLPELGRSLGKGINEFKDGLSNIGEKDDEDDEEEKAPQPAELTAPPGTEPEVVENVNRGAQPEVKDAEPVEAEVVPERQD